jgi:hypothetical protein
VISGETGSFRVMCVNYARERAAPVAANRPNYANKLISPSVRRVVLFVDFPISNGTSITFLTSKFKKYREIEKKRVGADQTFQLAIREISINRCQS